MQTSDVMSSLVEKLDALSIDDEKERKDLFGYIYSTKPSKNYFICENDFIVIPNCDNKKIVLCKLVRLESRNCFLCFACENSTVFENMNNYCTASCINEDVTVLLLSIFVFGFVVLE